MKRAVPIDNNFIYSILSGCTSIKHFDQAPWGSVTTSQTSSLTYNVEKVKLLNEYEIYIDLRFHALHSIKHNRFMYVHLYY